MIGWGNKNNPLEIAVDQWESYNLMMSYPNAGFWRGEKGLSGVAKIIIDNPFFPPESGVRSYLCEKVHTCSQKLWSIPVKLISLPFFRVGCVVQYGKNDEIVHSAGPLRPFQSLWFGGSQADLKKAPLYTFLSRIIQKAPKWWRDRVEQKKWR